jgi:hypothetical protein
MTISFRRSAAVALAVLLPLAAPSAPAAAQDARSVPAQASAELQRRAEALFKGVTRAGGKASYGALEPGASPEGLRIKNIEILSPEKKKVTIEEIDIAAYDWASPEEPRYADLVVKKLVVAADALDADAAGNLRELGLSALVVNAELAFKFDDKEKAFDVSKLFIDFAEMGELRLRLKLTGITAADLKTAVPGEKAEPGKPAPGKPEGQDAQALMSLLSRLNIAGAAIGFRDKSLIERIVRADAKKKSMTESAARAKMLEELAEERSKAEDDVTKEFIDAAIKFLKNPGEIELALNPPAPANVMAAFMLVMGNRGTFKQMLGLSVSVKQ